MKKCVKFYAFLLFFLISVICTSTTFADTQKQWITLPTSVNQDGTTANTEIYGYYTDIDNFGQVFVVCDPNTGQETGYAYIPNVKIGDKQTQEVVGYKDSKVLDWDNPKQIYPVSVSVIMPNVPASVGWDLDYYNKTGILQRKTASTVTFPGSSSFVYKVPGSNPNYWLIVAQVTNPNSFPVTTNVSIKLGEFSSISFSGTVSLGSNETKYVLLNNKTMDILPYEGGWNNNNYNIYTLLYYDANISSNNDPEYPGNDPNYSYINYFTPWSLIVDGFGNSYNEVPQIPMRPTYYFDLSDISEFEDCSERELLDSREGYAIYNIETNQWDFVDMSLKQMDSKAVSYLRPLFARFGFSAPIILNWEYDKSGIVLSSDKYSSTKAFFNHLYPVPDPFIKGTTAKTSMSWYDELAGWLGTSYSGYTHGAELSGPVVCSPSYKPSPYSSPEMNFGIYYAGNNFILAGRGTVISGRDDPRYYSSDWMDNLPVVKAEPMFIDQYTFVPTDGNNIGYLQKNTVPGYYLYVSDEERPTISINTQPTEIDATCRYLGDLYYNSFYNQYFYNIYEDSWTWTPSVGWQKQYSKKIVGFVPYGEKYADSWGLDPLDHKYGITGKTYWNVNYKYNLTVIGNNPDDFPVSWSEKSNVSYLTSNGWYTPSYPPNLYCESLRNTQNAILNKINNGGFLYNGYWAHYDSSYINSLNINPTITLSEIPSLEAKSTKYFISNSNVFNVNFTRSLSFNNNYSSISLGEEEQNTLNDISNVCSQLSATEEAAFINGFTFNITPTFQAGTGGVVSGAQKIYIGNFYDYYTQEYNNNVVLKRTIGFDNAGNTLFSWYSPIAPLNGVVAQPNDILFASVFGHNSITSYSPYVSSTPPYVNYSNTPQWKIYDSQHDLVLPIDRPQ